MKKSSIDFLILTLTGILLIINSSWVQASEYYEWPAYSPTIAYDYQDEFVTIDPPTQVMDDVTGVDGEYIDRWWCFRWGANKNPEVTEADWIPMLERLNEDFDYITNVMRWPRDKRVQNGYYSTVYLYGSGLSTDNADMWDTGGWQGTTWYNGDWWPMILASYYPVHCFDPAYTNGDKGYQTGAMVHEGIHCILSGMPGCFNSCWFHEGGNTWLQATMEAQRSGSFTGMGWLSVGSAIAPFMPIECYSGWLQDGSFGGPCAQGVYQEGGVCTWRNLLGGVQYSESFPHALEVILGPKSLAWVWRNADHSGRVLQDLAEAPGGLGEAQTRRLIQEYRGRQAFCDFGLWSYAYRQLLHGSWGVAIQEEYEPFWYDVDPWYATCYVDTTQNGSELTPDTLTLPGWSGANQIPLTVNPSAIEATVTFNPIGANMSCQLVYRDTSGNVHYGVPVSSGACSIPLANVRNNVVIAVICNTDYIYVDDSTRQAKYDYTLTMGAGVTGTADIYTKWFDYNPASYTVTASAGANGSISPSGAVSVNAGASKTFTFTPDSGYEVDEVILNGFEIGAMSSYTLNDVRGDCTVGVTFKIIGGDETPPTPNPATWASVPAPTATDTISMTATTGSDASGVVEYYFAEISGNPGGTDSGWQSSPTYTDTGLSDYMEYTYQVRTRDAYDNRGVWSSSESVMTSAPAGGTTIGTTGSWENNPAVRRDAALDGDLNTYFDSNLPTGGWVGLDFGEPYVIKYIRYAPRVTFAGRMVGGEFQGSNTADFSSGVVTLFTVPTAPPEGILTGRAITDTNGYRYVRYYGPANGYCNVSEIEFYGDTYANTPPVNPGGLVATAGDGSVSLDWDDNTDPDLMHYDIYRSTTTGSGYVSIYSGQATSDYVDNSVTNPTTYYYVVTAVDTNSNESGYSNEDSAVPNIYDGTQGMEDLLGFAAEWLTFDCALCGGANLDGLDGVTISDFSMLGQNWLISENLQLYLKLDEAAGDIAGDSSTYGRDGSLVNGPVWDTGHIDGALNFDGTDDYVEVTGYKGITGNTSRTCSAWVKTSSVSGEILTWGSEAGNGNRWIIRVNEGGQLRAEVQGGNIIGTTLINDSTWHHIAVVITDDGSPDIMEAQLYVDGQLEVISDYTDEPINTDSVEDVTLGAYFATGAPRYYQGLIDDMRIYNVALSEQEILFLSQ